MHRGTRRVVVRLGPAERAALAQPEAVHVNEGFVAERVDELLTVYNSAIDGRAIGFQIKGVQAIIRKFGFDGLAILSEADAHGVKSISVAMLLLAAYEEGPQTMGRRKAYAWAMCQADKTISTDELQAA